MQTTISTFLLLAAISAGSTHPTVSSGIADASAQSVQALVAETQRTSENPKRVELVWWIPVEFWRLTMISNPSVSKDQIEQVVRVLSSYTLIAVADGDIGPFGGVTWTTEETLRSRLVMLDSNDQEYKPLPAEQINSDAKNLVVILKPVFANLLGSLGENLRFFYFGSRTRAGAPTADVTTPGRFSVKVADSVYRWRLPLGSLLPQKVCPIDGERMSGAWMFCPWHGNALVSAP